MTALIKISKTDTASLLQNAWESQPCKDVGKILLSQNWGWPPLVILKERMGKTTTTTMTTTTIQLLSLHDSNDGIAINALYFYMKSLTSKVDLISNFSLTFS